MNKYLLLLSINLILSVSLKAQNDSLGFGLGFDFSFHKEPKINEYKYPPLAVNGATHYDYLPNLTYSFSEKSLLGLTLGFGHAKSNKYNDFQDQVEYFNSNSSEIGIFYKYRFLRYNNINIFIQPVIQFMVINQTTEIHQDNGVVGNFATESLDILSLDLQLKAGLEYTLLKKISFFCFISNDIVSKENTKAKVAFIQSSNKWIFLKDYLVFGIGLHYKF